MSHKLVYYWAALLSATLLTACGGKTEEEKQAEEASVSLGGAVGAMQEMAKAAEEQQKNGPVKTVDFRALKELLPADADGLPRKEATGEKTGTMGFNVSTAEGKYASADGSERIEVDIVDAGGMGAMMGLAAWSMIEVDKETETGYEKTTEMDGNKAYEKYDNAGKDGEIAVMVAKRFVVTAKGNGVSMDKIKATLKEVDLGKLAELK
ncbi:MAG: transposase [Bacteroidetes bacterium]|nr:transposase [Fibrella sp.]